MNEYKIKFKRYKYKPSIFSNIPTVTEGLHFAIGDSVIEVVAAFEEDNPDRYITDVEKL